jgi:uncharacterized MAPEG superfamily protein
MSLLSIIAGAANLAWVRERMFVLASLLTNGWSIVEIPSIVFAAALIWLSVLVQHLNNVKSKGTAFVMSDRSTPLDEGGFTGRATRTLRNNMESALMYAPVALVAVISHTTGELTKWIAIVYMVARALFTVGYWLNVSFVRPPSWLVGMVCVLALTVDVIVSLL